MIQADRDQTPAVPGPIVAARRVPVDAFDLFFNHTYPLLVKVAIAAGASVEEAEDAANETMTYAYEHWSSIRDHRAYVRRSVVNAVAKAKRRDRERVARSIAGGYAVPEASDDGSVTAWEDREWVLQLLRALPPAEREVMACLVDGLSSAEMAAVFGKTTAAIRKNLQLARTRLRRLLVVQQDTELHRGPSNDEPTRRKTR